MASKRRLCIPGEIHYIYARSIKERELFEDDEDKNVFLKLLNDGIRLTGFKCLKYELSERFYKIFVRINNLPLCALFQRLNSLYALAYNKRHGREGHLFLRRFKSVVLDKSHTEKFLSSQNTSGNEVPLPNKNISSSEDKNGDTQHDKDVSFLIENINKEVQHKYEPRCWSIGSIEFIAETMHNLQKEHRPVSQYTLTDWSLEKLRDFVLSKIPATLHEFDYRGRMDLRSSARKLFSYLAIKILGYRVAEIGRFLKISGTAASKLAKKGELIAKENKITLPQKTSEIPTNVVPA